MKRGSEYRDEKNAFCITWKALKVYQVEDIMTIL